VTAFLSTLAVGLALPVIVPGLLRFLWWIYLGTNSSRGIFERSTYTGLIQIALAAFCWRRLYYRLVKRSFPLERADVR